MSKRYNIKWTESDNAELKKTVKNFNAKISRLERKYPKLKNVLPEKITVEQMKQLIDTRQDFKREMNSLRRFTDRKNVIRQNVDGTFTGVVDVPENKYNLKTTKWQKEEMTRRVSYINRVRKQKADQILNLEMKSRGERLGYTRGQIGMGTIDENALKPMNPFYATMQRGDLNMRFKAIKTERQIGYWMKKELMLVENVTKGLLANYNAPEFKDDIQQIISAIENMSFNEFYNRFMAETGVMEIVSPPAGSDSMNELRINISALKSTWIPNYKPEED